MKSKNIILSIIALLLVQLACTVEKVNNEVPVTSTHTAIITESETPYPSIVPTVTEKPSSTLEYPKKMQVLVDNLHIREKPDETSTSLGVLVKGNIVKVFSCNGGWCKIEKGYVKQKFIGDVK